MCSLHWLPIKYKIKYKVLLLVYKALNGSAPTYMCDMLKPYKPSTQLQSSEKNLLEEPRFKLKSVGYRSFEVAAPRLWNTLPYSIRNSKCVIIFKRELKTFLFRIAYDSILKSKVNA